MAKAISALEKQIPQRVIYSDDGYDDSTMAYCPYCDTVFDKYDWQHWESNFCSYCGQRLNWKC